jgi:hypothetical protein
MKPDFAIKRHPLSLRTTQELRTKMEAAVAISGRSLAQEVEFRLEQSFDRDAILKMVREAVASGS